MQAYLDAGYNWVVDVDIQRYFDTIPHRLLMVEIEKEISDRSVLTLIEAYLKQGVLEGTKSYAALEQGTPQAASSARCWRMCIFIPSMQPWRLRVTPWCAMPTTVW